MSQKNQLLFFLDEILKIRTIEETLQKTFLEQKIFSFLHLMIGQEAVSVGICSALTNDDIVMGNHRSHGHYIAKGGNVERMIREILGDKGGCCNGYGGSMHMLDRSINFDGSTPILGSVSGLILGKALSLKLSKKENVAVCFLGDGAAEEGIFYESVNLACSKELPVIFVIEDNKYAVNTKHADRKSLKYNFKNIFEGFGANYFRVDGQNVLCVNDIANKCRQLALNFEPCVLHADVFRMHGHSGPLLEKENEDYREMSDTISKRREMDCINILKKIIIDNQVLSMTGYNDYKNKLIYEHELKILSIIEKINVRQ